MSDDDLVRKALEKRLKAQHAALLAVIPDDWKDELVGAGWPVDEFPIKWPNIAFNASKAITYLQFTFHPSSVKYPELGRRSRKESEGFALIGVRTPEGAGDDISGDLVKVIETAYPYADDLEEGGLTVRIEGVEGRPGYGSDGKWYRPVNVNWLISRRPS
ncbi:tail protein [Caulobacter phage Sansa]|uniref:Tail protein n=1 Tax=Caulobacter phage Sansa TaxID=1675600 RepID=A0A0K1LLR6_9CAUD|nr:tail terminator [Caulobacter phage Sansa]AKU43436.1 tail protein [Caulobacter phage Sansa]